VNPFQGIPEIGKCWNNLTNTDPEWWRGVYGLFWVCGKRAYTELPRTWKGSCTIGVTPTTKGNSWDFHFLKFWGLELKGTLRLGANRDGEKINGFLRGLSKPMDQPPGHRMGARVTGFLSYMLNRIIRYRQL
jgi:hypothetical protein